MKRQNPDVLTALASMLPKAKPRRSIAGYRCQSLVQIVSSDEFMAQIPSLGRASKTRLH